MNHEDQKELKASLSLPLTDTLGIRLNGYFFEDRGFYKNTTTGAYVGGGDGLGGSMTVKWQPNEVYSLKFRTEYSDDNFDAAAQASVPFNGTSAVPQQASSCRTYSIANPGPTPTDAGRAPARRHRARARRVLHQPRRQCGFPHGGRRLDHGRRAEPGRDILEPATGGPRRL